MNIRLPVWRNVRSVRHSDTRNTTHREKERKRTEVREKEGRITPLCADELSPALIIRETRRANGKEEERETEDHPRWTQVDSFRNLTKPHRSSRPTLRPVTPFVSLTKMTKHFLSSCPGPRVCTFPGPRKLNNPRRTRSPGNTSNDRARVYYAVYINV